MDGGDKLIRQWKVLHILAARGSRTVQDLMQEMKCSRRIVWRHLALLQGAGFPITSEQGRAAERRNEKAEKTRGHGDKGPNRGLLTWGGGMRDEAGQARTRPRQSQPSWTRRSTIRSRVEEMAVATLA